MVKPAEVAQTAEKWSEDVGALALQEGCRTRYKTKNEWVPFDNREMRTSSSKSKNSSLADVLGGDPKESIANCEWQNTEGGRGMD